MLCALYYCYNMALFFFSEVLLRFDNIWRAWDGTLKQASVWHAQFQHKDR